MSLISQLTSDMKTAMKAGDKGRLMTIRMLMSAIRYAKIDKPDMNDEDELLVLQKEAKKRRESIVAYKEAGRDDQVTLETEELKIIESYLPAMMTEEEVKNKVVELLKLNQPTNFGMAMNAVMKELKGKADGGLVAKVVKAVYQA